MARRDRGLDGPIHVVSLRSQSQRRARLERRAAHHGIQLRWVDALGRDAPLVEELLEGTDSEVVTEHRRGEIACLASHLRAIRMALDAAPVRAEGVLIGEDDIVPHDDWAQRLRLLDDVLSPDATLCCLSYLLDPESTLPDDVGSTEGERVVRLERAAVMGTQLYWISRQYALDVLASLDAPVHTLPSPPTAELITMRSDGYFVVPPLAIEEGLDSALREASDLAWHHDSQDRWDRSQYLAAEDEATRQALLALARRDG